LEIQFKILLRHDLPREHQSPTQEVGIEAKLLTDKLPDGFKDCYSGFLPNLETAENYIGTLLSESSKADRIGTETSVIPEIICSEYYTIVEYDYEKYGVLVITADITKVNDVFTAEKVDDVLLDRLEILEREFLIDSREEKVNHCDYWRGFWGSSYSIWHWSNYRRGSPKEMVEQLLYEVNEGLRDPTAYKEMRSWRCPTPIEILELKIPELFDSKHEAVVYLRDSLRDLEKIEAHDSLLRRVEDLNKEIKNRHYISGRDLFEPWINKKENKV